MTDYRPDTTEQLEAALARRILVLDGAMGTMIQANKPSAEDYHGERFKDHHKELRGDNDLLETNTFNATRASQSDYDLEDLVPELNREGARLARQAADEAMSEDPGRTVWVAGVLGPTSRTASISPDVNDPGFRNTSLMIWWKPTPNRRKR